MLRCDCGRQFSHRQSLNRHRKQCAAVKRTIITEPAEGNFPMIEYVQPETQDDDDDPEPLFNSDEPEPPFNPHPPYNAAPTQRFFDKPSFSHKTTTIDLSHQYNDNFTTCENLQHQIEQLILSGDMCNAELTGKLVLEDRKLYETYINQKLPAVLREQEKLSTRRKELERELGVNGNDINIITSELSCISTSKALDRAIKIHRFTAEYFSYEMKFNEKFSAEIPALKILKHNVEQYRNLSLNNDIIQTGLNQNTVNDMLASTKYKTAKEERRKMLTYICSALFILIAVIVLLSTFTIMQFFLFVLFNTLMVIVYFANVS